MALCSGAARIFVHASLACFNPDLGATCFFLR
jgi:hypothetical protein